MKKVDLLSQRSEDKLPLGDANVGDGQTLVVELDVVVEEDVEVDVSGPLVYELLAAQGLFDALKGVEQFQRLQGGLNLAYGLVTETGSETDTRLTNLAGAVDKSILV